MILASSLMFNKINFSLSNNKKSELLIRFWLNIVLILVFNDLILLSMLNFNTNLNFLDGKIIVFVFDNKNKKRGKVLAKKKKIIFF